MNEKKLRKLGKRIVDEAVYETIMGRACTYCRAGTERRTDELVHEEGCLTEEMRIALADEPNVVWQGEGWALITEGCVEFDILGFDYMTEGQLLIPIEDGQPVAMRIERREGEIGAAVTEEKR